MVPTVLGGSMAKTKVLCVVGTRPEVIKVAPVVLELRRRAGAFAVELIVTAQHRQMLDQMMTVFALQADADLDIMRPNQSLKDVSCRVLDEMDRLLAARRPDLVLAQGDTTTVMATAVACFYNHTAFGHVEAGLRTGDRWAPYPEEFNRRVAALVARHHFAPTGSAAQNLVREGIDPATVYVTGNTVLDALNYVLARTAPPPKPVPDGAPYILMTCHRREIFGAPIREVFQTVCDFAAAHPDVYIWYPVHPNPNVSKPAREILDCAPNVILSEPLDYIAFLHAMNGAYLILSDSGGVQEEGPALGKPVLVLRDVTERPEGVAAGTCLLVGPHRDRIEAALTRLFEDRAAYEAMARAKNPYGDGRAAERIANVLEGRPYEIWTG
jgi:UDP-N-acetylglucosamine 2-epimerase (non-hydrolysing)